MCGFSGTKKEALKIWEERARIWQPNGLPPWRPSAGDIALYEKLAGDKLRGRVLILGATPELRDLVYRYNRKYFIADMSPAMILRMTEFLVHADPADEVWIKADWCELPLPENYLDAVIGDMPWTVTTFEEQEKFTDGVASFLKADGVFVTRARLRNPARLGEDGFEVIKRYLDKLDSHPDRYHLICNEMVSYLHDVTADAAAKKTDESKTKTLILGAIESSKASLHRKFLEGALRRSMGANWTSQTPEELFAILERKFHVIDKLRAPDYDSEWYPVIALEKNA